jgi:hypothetical protein
MPPSRLSHLNLGGFLDLMSCVHESFLLHHHKPSVFAGFAKQLLDVADNLERACNAVTAEELSVSVVSKKDSMRRGALLSWS